MAWAATDRHRAFSSESPDNRRNARAQDTARRMVTLSRLTLAIVILWTLATFLWVIDPAFLLHLRELLAELAADAMPVR